MDNIDKKTVNDEGHRIIEINTSIQCDRPVKCFDDGKEWIYTLTDSNLVKIKEDIELLVEYRDIEDKLLPINSEYSKTIRLYDGIDITFVVWFDKDKYTDEAILKIFGKVAKDVLLYKLGHDDHAIYLLLKSVFTINFKLSLYKCNKPQEPEPADKADASPKMKPNDGPEHTLVLNPFGDPRNLSYGFFGYPDLENTCTYCVLKYSYTDYGKYDSLVVYSKDTKRLSIIGMNDTYSTFITDRNGCKIEYVFSIKRDICGIISKYPGFIEIKIWARIPVDYINSLGLDDGSICSYLREVYEKHFKIGLQKSDKEDE